MKNSRLLLIVLSNLIQLGYYIICYNASFYFFLFQYIGFSLCFGVPYILDTQPKQKIYYILLSAIPIYLLSLLVNSFIELCTKLFDYLDSKEQIIK